MALGTMYLGTLSLRSVLGLDASVSTANIPPFYLGPSPRPRDWGHFLTELSHGIWLKTIRFHRSGQVHDDSPQLRYGRLYRVFPSMNGCQVSNRADATMVLLKLAI